MKTAIDRLIYQPQLIKNFGRIGLVVNQASTSSDFTPTVDVIWNATKKTKNVSLNALFGPQHGYAQTEQDNMKETFDSFFVLNDNTKIPLFSLYSKLRTPSREQLEQIDTLVVDLKDVGCRIYTYMLTLAGCLRAAAEFGKKIVVLDRPNPLGLCVKKQSLWRRVEGNCLDTRFHSFVGWYPLPMRHGLTLGELGHFFVKCDKLNVDYSVIPVQNLKRAQSSVEMQKLNWIMPSPNLPTWLGAYFFPAFVCLEGTNVSEGRGTTIPFELIGAPWLHVKKCIHFLKKHANLWLTTNLKLDPGVKPRDDMTTLKLPIAFREHTFRPTFNKYAGEVCHGIHFGILEHEKVNLFALGMCFLYYCNLFHKDDFQWSRQKYEYNTVDLPINLILGSSAWIKIFASAKENCENLKELLHKSNQEAQNFAQNNQDIFIYT